MAKKPTSDSKGEPKSALKRRTRTKASTKRKAPKVPVGPRVGAAPVVTLERVKEVVERYRPLLMVNPNVKYVTAGLKQIKGHYAHQSSQPDEYCVVIYVEKKWPAKKTEAARAKQAQQDGAIPATLDGVPTDIRPVPMAKATLSGGATVQPELLNGKLGGRGTLAIVCQDVAGQQGFVTAAHVACPEKKNPNSVVFAADTGPTQKVGTVFDSQPGVGIGAYDCAFVAIDEGVPPPTFREVIDPMTGTMFPIDPQTSI